MKTILTWLAAAAMAFVFSLDDFAWPSDDCSEYLTVIKARRGELTILVADISGTDTECANFAWCLRNLFDLPGVVRVEIANPAEQWVPSAWRSIDYCHARALNEPWDEYGTHDSIEAFLEDCYEAMYEQETFAFNRDGD